MNEINGILYYPLDKEGYSKYDLNTLQKTFNEINENIPMANWICLPQDIGIRFIQDKEIFISLLKKYLKILEEADEE